MTLLPAVPLFSSGTLLHTAVSEEDGVVDATDGETRETQTNPQGQEANHHSHAIERATAAAATGDERLQSF